MTATELPPLTATARRRALCELADLYHAEQNSSERPLSDVLPLLLRDLVANHMYSDLTIDMFDRVARCRAVARRADMSYDRVHAAEARAERLLDQLVGEVAA